MDYALRIVVEKVAISSQEVIKRDTITSYCDLSQRLGSWPLLVMV